MKAHPAVFVKPNLFQVYEKCALLVCNER